MRAEFYNLLHRNETKLLQPLILTREKNYKTLREAEHALLQGPDSHEFACELSTAVS